MSTTATRAQKRDAKKNAQGPAAGRVLGELLPFKHLQGMPQLLATWLRLMGTTQRSGTWRPGPLERFYQEHIGPDRKRAEEDPVLPVLLIDANGSQISEAMVYDDLVDLNAFAEGIAVRLFEAYGSEALVRSTKSRAWSIILPMQKVAQSDCFVEGAYVLCWTYARCHGGDLCGETDPIKATFALAQVMGYARQAQRILDEEYAKELGDLTGQMRPQITATESGV